MRHGGNLEEAAERYGDPALGWLDLSTGINPRPYPTADLNPLHLSMQRLPSPGAIAGLLAAARKAYDVQPHSGIAAGPGAEILIRTLPEIIEGPTALVDTSYRSYGESWASRGHSLPVETLPALEAQPATSVILVNPNNPDGRLLTARDVLTLARGRGEGAIVVVDESYAEAEPNASVVAYLKPDDPVLVLKSFGKFFGLPGLRLGFAIGPQTVIDSLGARLGDWPASGPAITIATRALADEGWRSQTRHWLGNQAQSLDSVLRAARVQSAGGCRLFRVAHVSDSVAVHARLARQGVWTRIFEDRPGLIRFGLPPDSDGLVRLADALAFT
jgi:cobalamin biosynthetic protein CobC